MSDIFRDFDKKNEFPKVKIPKFATGGIFNDAIFPKLDAFLQIDEIVKDIRDSQDNAMAMEFTKCIGELLKKNGVVPKITEYTHENVKEHSIEQLYGVNIDELDFSEHDKVFENEIAGLKAKIAIKDMDYKTASELLGKYQQENKSLKQRIDELEKELEEWKEEARVVKKQRDEQLKSFRKGIEPYVDLLHMHETIAELKQRIAELESKETSDLPFDPLECANYLINATYERETSSLERAFAKVPDKVNSDRYTVDELEQIAEHLLVYCKHNKESEE